jgi:hypothetical protein
LFLLHPNARLQFLNHLYKQESIEQPLRDTGRNIRDEMEGPFRMLQALTERLCSDNSLESLSEEGLRQRATQLSGLLSAMRLLALNNVRRYLDDTHKMSEQLSTKVLPIIEPNKDAASDDFLREIAPITLALATLPPFERRLRTAITKALPLTASLEVAAAFTMNGIQEARDTNSKENALTAICSRIALAAVQVKSFPQAPKQLINRIFAVTKVLIEQPRILWMESDAEKEVPSAIRSHLCLFGAAVQILPPTLRLCSVLLEEHYGRVLEKGVLAQVEESALKSSPQPANTAIPTEAAPTADGFASEATNGSTIEAPSILDRAVQTKKDRLRQQPTRATLDRSADYRLAKRLEEKRTHDEAHARRNERVLCLEVIKAELARTGGLTPSQLDALPLAQSLHTRSIEAWADFSQRLANAFPLTQLATPANPHPLAKALYSAPWLLTMSSDHFTQYTTKLAAVSAALVQASERVPKQYKEYAPSAKHPEYSIFASPENFRRIKDLTQLENRIEGETRNVVALTTGNPPLHPVVVSDVLALLAASASETPSTGFVCSAKDNLPLEFATRVLQESQRQSEALTFAHKGHIKEYMRETLLIYQALGRNLSVQVAKKSGLSTVVLNLGHSLPHDATSQELLLRELLVAKIEAATAPIQGNVSTQEEGATQNHSRAAGKRRTRLDSSEIPLAPLAHALARAKS